MSFISLVKAEKYSDFKKAIERSFNLIGFHLLPDFHKIVVKPNMCYYRDYSTGETTDPKIIAGLIDFLRENASSELQISIVESDTSTMRWKYSSRFLGYEKMSKEKRVTLVNLTEDRSEEIKVKVKNRSFAFLLPSTIKNADLFINVPKIKYMTRTKISCALKNIYGCNPYPEKFKYHPYVNEVIVGLNKLMKTSLCLVDGIIVQGKHTKKLGLLMASADPVAIDSAAARIIGLNPQKINHIVLAEKEGVGDMNFKVVGENLQYFAELFPKRSAGDKIRSTIINFGLSTLRILGRNPSY